MAFIIAKELIVPIVAITLPHFWSVVGRKQRVFKLAQAHGENPHYLWPQYTEIPGLRL